jgi:hypothetical protein
MMAKLVEELTLQSLHMLNYSPNLSEPPYSFPVQGPLHSLTKTIKDFDPKHPKNSTKLLRPLPPILVDAGNPSRRYSRTFMKVAHFAVLTR